MSQYTGGFVVRWMVWITNKFDLAVNVILIPFVTAVIFTNVALRYLLNSPMQGAKELAGLCLFLFFTAILPAVTQSDAHVRMELVYENLPRQVRKYLNLVGYACGFFFMALLAWAFLGVTMWHQLHFAQDTMNLRILLWPFSLFAGICCAFVALQYALLMAGIYQPVDKKDPAHDPDTPEM
jgi:TRAP-type C4-dicarboxylate transport system permease small subunit